MVMIFEGELYIYIIVVYFEFVNFSRILDRFNFVVIKFLEIVGIFWFYDGGILIEKMFIEILIFYILYCF